MRLRSALSPKFPVSTKRLRRVLVATVRLALAVVATASSGACAGQGEGQLCNPKAGNSGTNDCQSGLTCQSRPDFVMPPYGICCQPNGQSTTTACSVNGSSVDASPAPPADASVAETAADAPGESAAEAAAEGADGPVDSSAEAAMGADGADAATE